MGKMRDIVDSALHPRRLTRSPVDGDEPFEVDCPCGTTLGGFRRRQHATLRCPNCEEAVYIQALNPRRPPKPRRGRKHSDWPTTTITPRREVEPRRRVMIDSPEEPAGPPPTETFARVRHHLFLRGRAAWSELHTRAKAIRPPHFSRLQITMAAVALLVVATAAWQWDRYRQRQFAKDLVAYTSTGIESLAGGDFSAARDELRRADRAARGLRGDSPRQRAARQLYREADIWSSLAVGSIHRLTSGTLNAPPVDPQQWPEQFNERFLGRCLIFDARVTRTALYASPLKVKQDSVVPQPLDPPQSPAIPTGLKLEWAAIGPNARIEVVVPEVPEFASIDIGESRRVLFGARLAGLAPSPTEPGLWLLRLEPESCTPVTLTAPLEHLGWPDDEQLRTLIAQQAGEADVEYER